MKTVDCQKIVAKVTTLFVMVLLFLASCKEQKTFSEEEEAMPEAAAVVYLEADSASASDTVYLSQLAEEVSYLSLDLPNKSRILQMEYADSLIFANTIDEIYWFGRKGELLGSVSSKANCFDLSEHRDSIYVYQPLEKRLSCYDLNGRRVWTSRLRYKEEEAGTYGHSFVRVTDSIFAIAIRNQGFNPDRLIFVDKNGRVKGRIFNPETFPCPGNSYTAHTEWRRLLTRNRRQTFYHPLYNDTVYGISDDMQLVPAIVERKVSKVPLEARPEYTGKTWKQFEKDCLQNLMYVTRVFNTERYAIVEYKPGGIGACMANYWVCDRKEKSLKRTFNDLGASFLAGKAHFGIYNDYDGGLAFAPDFISNEHLIMVNAGDLQGYKSIFAKQIYAHNVSVMKTSYLYRSDVFQSLELKRKADDFWAGCDENKITLTIVKMKPL